MNIYTTIICLLISLASVFGQGIVPKKMSFAGMTLELSNSARGKIQAEVNKIRKSEKHFQMMVDKADIHFQVVNEVFKQEGFPDDIKYLMIQESGFNADAVSSSKAVGFWQFKEGTAKEVGLKVERGIDERKNLAEASRGAAKYMSKTNKKVDNWIYAVLSYNVGPGGVMKHIKQKNVGARKMKIEGNIHWYVIKFLAHKVAYEGDVGKRRPKTDLSVETGFGGKNLRQVARKENLNEEDVLKYNRWISASKKIPTDKDYLVILPKKGQGGDVFAKGTSVGNKPVKIPNSQSGLDWPPKATSKPKKDIPTYRKEKIHRGDAVVKYDSPKENIRYKVNDIDVIVAKSGDNSHKLALIGGITKKKFIKYNEIQTFTQLEPGLTYYLKKKKGKGRLNFHVVEEEQTIWEISQMYGMKSKAIRSKNRMSKREEPNEGRVLWLRITRPSTTAVEYRKRDKKPKVEKKVKPTLKTKPMVKERPPSVNKSTKIKKVEGVTKPSNNEEVIHIVGQGETLYSVSRQYDVAVEDIKRWNKLESNTLSIGDRLILSERMPQKEKNAKVYTVKQGDTLYSISRQFNISVSDLLKLNNKADGTISIGEELRVK